MKKAADALNKQLPKEAQGGSLQPLVEEKEEGEGQGQAIDTFSSEIDSFDQVLDWDQVAPLEATSSCRSLMAMLRPVMTCSHPVSPFPCLSLPLRSCPIAQLPGSHWQQKLAGSKSQYLEPVIIWRQPSPVVLVLRATAHKLQTQFTNVIWTF